jgi:hypothetical protein
MSCSFAQWRLTAGRSSLRRVHGLQSESTFSPNTLEWLSELSAMFLRSIFSVNYFPTNAGAKALSRQDGHPVCRLRCRRNLQALAAGERTLQRAHA